MTTLRLRHTSLLTVLAIAIGWSAITWSETAQARTRAALIAAANTGVGFCTLLGGPAGTDNEPEDSMQSEVWYWYNVHRLKASRLLWNPEGRSVIKAQLRLAASDMDRQCLRQLLREARRRALDR